MKHNVFGQGTVDEAKRMGKGRYTIYDGQEDMAQTLQALELSAFPAYAIDPDSCELLFANAKMCARFPSLRPGEKCYRSLMEGAQTPCEGCDLQAELEKTAFRQERAACMLCGEWLRASLTRVRWQDGRSVLLFCCRPAKAAGDAEADGERADG